MYDTIDFIDKYFNFLINILWTSSYNLTMQTFQFEN